MAEHHSQEEVLVIKAMSLHELAKENNRCAGGAFVGGGSAHLKHEERAFLIREELVARGILSSVDEVRLINGKELNL